MTYKITLLPGDGIGPEVVGEAVKVIETLGELFDNNFEFETLLIGGCATDAYGYSYMPDTAHRCKLSDAILLGAVGGPKWASLEKDQRPETALLNIRKDLQLYANLRPAALRPALASACPLREATAEKGFDIMIVRELTGGIYFGERGRKGTGEEETAYDILPYSVKEIERICHKAFQFAMLRSKKVASVDKANVLETSRLWREVFHRVAKEYPEVEIEDVLVDNAAMQLVRNPSQYDVMVTENMFGDILSDEASMLTGSIGLLPSASMGDSPLGLYEPIHGSAPDIAGQDKANPIATILSVAMMCRYSLKLPKEADLIEQAVDAVLNDDYRTPDIMSEGKKQVGTKEMGNLICTKLRDIIAKA